MALYLIDKPFGVNGLHLAELDSDAKVVLLQDGVYLKTDTLAGKPVYAIKPDVEKRGISCHLPESVKLIDYPELVDLIVAEKVYNFV
jgi:tRNA 2-thiouridine synthesizing protein B